MMVVSIAGTDGLFQRSGTNEQIGIEKEESGWLRHVLIPFVVLRFITGEVEDYFVATQGRHMSLASMFQIIFAS